MPRYHVKVHLCGSEMKPLHAATLFDEEEAISFAKKAATSGYVHWQNDEPVAVYPPSSIRVVRIAKEEEAA